MIYKLLIFKLMICKLNIYDINDLNDIEDSLVYTKSGVGEKHS